MSLRKTLSISRGSGKKLSEAFTTDPTMGDSSSNTSSESSSSSSTPKRSLTISRATGKDGSSSTIKTLPPMPEPEELDKMFLEVITKMNIQEQDRKNMLAFPAEKKWQLVLDSDVRTSLEPPGHYLDLIEHHIKKRKKNKKISPKEIASTEKDLRGTEISLRTNPLSWINQFIDPPNNGFEKLMDFLLVIHEGPEFDKERHLCLMCIKAVMNNKYGLNYVLKQPKSIKQLVDCLSFDQEKTHILLFNILNAVCVVAGPEGHKLILEALDAYKVNHNEPKRFQTLVSRMADEKYNYDYKASCLSFINVFVHSPDNIYFRSYLQYEFTLLGLDGLIDTLLHANFEDLNVQINGYLANFIHIEDSGQRTLKETQSDLDDDKYDNSQEKIIARLQKQMQEKEQVAANTISELQKLLSNLQSKKEIIGDEELKKRIEELELENKKLKSGEISSHPQPPTETSTTNTTTSTTDTTTDTPTNANDSNESGGSPPPPPPPPGIGAPPPPPPPGMGAPIEQSGLPPKRKFQPKVPLPTLNWTPIKDPKNTIFSEIDDENFHKNFDYSNFEQRFKRDIRESTLSRVAMTIEKKKTKEEVQVIDMNRSRAVLLAMKKIDLKQEDIGKAIMDLNRSKVSGEMADILLKCLPTQDEAIALAKHASQLDKLAEGDRFMYFLSTIERCETKLRIMSFIDSFQESTKILEPQIASVITATTSIRNSMKLKKIFEIILAFGNYMNSAKRGGAYGFKLGALDRLSDPKSVSTPQTLLHFIVELISKEYSAYNNFYSDLISLEAASSVSLISMAADIQELVNGYKLLDGEFKYLKGNKSIEEFHQKAGTHIETIQGDFKKMNEMYQSLVVYFGEDPKLVDSTEFFSIFLRFSRSYQTALKENEDAVKQAEKEKAKTQQGGPAKRARGTAATINPQAEKGAVDDVINEIKLRGFRR